MKKMWSLAMISVVLLACNAEGSNKKKPGFFAKQGGFSSRKIVGFRKKGPENP